MKFGAIVPFANKKFINLESSMLLSLLLIKVCEPGDVLEGAS
jgi:hypothetical protein